MKTEKQQRDAAIETLAKFILMKEEEVRRCKERVNEILKDAKEPLMYELPATSSGGGGGQ